MPGHKVHIRPIRPEDVDRVAVLWRLPVYRPEDQAEVAAMHERARRARETGDRWMPMPPKSSGHWLDSFLAFWVAGVGTVDSLASTGDIVGMAGVGSVAEDRELPDLPLAKAWRKRTDVAVLKEIGVAPQFRRLGIGTRLVETVVAWCRDNGYRSVILNTTSAQIPAIGLYRKCAFREALRSYLDQYELVWFERDVDT